MSHKHAFAPGFATCKFCARFMPVNVLISVNSLEAESESKYGMTELSHLTNLLPIAVFIYILYISPVARAY